MSELHFAAIDRVHRIGQEKTVHVTHFIVSITRFTGSDLFWHCYRWATLLKSGFSESRLAKLQLSMKHSMELARHQRASRTWKSCLERIRMYEEGNVVRCEYLARDKNAVILKSFSSNYCTWHMLHGLRLLRIRIRRRPVPRIRQPNYPLLCLFPSVTPLSRNRMPTAGYYAVRIGRKPGIYRSWFDLNVYKGDFFLILIQLTGKFAKNKSKPILVVDSRSLRHC